MAQNIARPADQVLKPSQRPSSSIIGIIQNQVAKAVVKLPACHPSLSAVKTPPRPQAVRKRLHSPPSPRRRESVDPKSGLGILCKMIDTSCLHVEAKREPPLCMKPISIRYSVQRPKPAVTEVSIDKLVAGMSSMAITDSCDLWESTISEIANLTIESSVTRCSSQSGGSIFDWTRPGRVWQYSSSLKRPAESSLDRDSRDKTLNIRWSSRKVEARRISRAKYGNKLAEMVDNGPWSMEDLKRDEELIVYGQLFEQHSKAMESLRKALEKTPKWKHVALVAGPLSVGLQDMEAQFDEIREADVNGGSQIQALWKGGRGSRKILTDSWIKKYNVMGKVDAIQEFVVKLNRAVGSASGCEFLQKVEVAVVQLSNRILAAVRRG